MDRAGRVTGFFQRQRIPRRAPRVRLELRQQRDFNRNQIGGHVGREVYRRERGCAQARQHAGICQRNAVVQPPVAASAHLSKIQDVARCVVSHETDAPENGIRSRKRWRARAEGEQSGNRIAAASDHVDRVEFARRFSARVEAVRARCREVCRKGAGPCDVLAVRRVSDFSGRDVHERNRVETHSRAVDMSGRHTKHDCHYVCGVTIIGFAKDTTRCFFEDKRTLGNIRRHSGWVMVH